MVHPILSELKPVAGTETNLYSTDVGQTANGTVFVMNQGSAVDFDRVRVAMVSNGNVISSNSYICFDSALYYGHSLYLQQLYLGSEDSIVVASENGTSSFIFTGQSD